MRTRRLHPAARALVNALVTIVIVLIGWQIVVSLSSPFVAKGPVDIWKYLFVNDKPITGLFCAGLSPLACQGQLLGQTLAHAALGFVVGMAVATALAVAFSLSRTVEASVMPLALFLRTVPLVAIAPVIILITGTGTAASVAVMTAIVVLFPALAAVLYGLSRPSQQSLDLIGVFGGGRWTQMRKVLLPGALPSLFAAARVSVPGAITGALLAEWLSTGNGVGYAIQTFPAAAKFNELWASVAVVTLVTLVIYNIVQVIENLVLDRMGMAQSAE